MSDDKPIYTAHEPAREYVEPAFPCNNDVDNEGIDMRDYFAAKVVAAMIANPGTTGLNGGDAQYLADTAYRIAEAMLERRKL